MKEENKMQIFFHIGRIKTGTTSIQHFLASNHKNLIKNNIYYGDYAQNWGGVPPAHFNVFYPFLKKLLQQLEFAHIAKEKLPAAQDFFVVMKKMIANAENTQCKKIIISCENFSQICTFIKIYTGLYIDTDKLCDTVKKIFLELENILNVECHFILYLREQCSFLLSDYNQAVKGGNFWGTFDEYVLGKLYTQDMDDVALTKIFTINDRLNVVSFEHTNSELNKNFIKLIDTNIETSDFIDIEKRYNTSLSFDILRFRIFLRDKLPKKTPSGIYYEFIFEKFQEEYSTKYKAKLIPREQTIQAIEHAFQKTNKIIQRKYFSYLNEELYSQYIPAKNTTPPIPIPVIMVDFIEFLLKHNIEMEFTNTQEEFSETFQEEKESESTILEQAETNS